MATSVNRVYRIPDRPINWLTEPGTRLALCNRGAPSFSFQGVGERQEGERTSSHNSFAYTHTHTHTTFYHLRLREGHTANIIIRVQPSPIFAPSSHLLPHQPSINCPTAMHRLRALLYTAWPTNSRAVFYNFFLGEKKNRFQRFVYTKFVSRRYTRGEIVVGGSKEEVLINKLRRG